MRSFEPDMRATWAAAALVALTPFLAQGCHREIPSPTPGHDPGFDKAWAVLAEKGVDAFYVEDDRGEGLMGNVRRAKTKVPGPAHPAPPSPATPGLPDEPPLEQVQQTIRENLMGVKACFLRVSRDSGQKSGKAIVSFVVAPDGHASNVRVDSPAFGGTALPGCVSGLVSRWVFPPSQKGEGPISYPFVFVGG